MKTIHILLIALVVVAFSASAYFLWVLNKTAAIPAIYTENPVNSNFKIYQSGELSFQYPSDWKIEQVNTNITDSINPDYLVLTSPDYAEIASIGNDESTNLIKAGYILEVNIGGLDIHGGDTVEQKIATLRDGVPKCGVQDANLSYEPITVSGTETLLSNFHDCAKKMNTPFLNQTKKLKLSILFH